jgi:hypothetical protein
MLENRMILEMEANDINYCKGQEETEELAVQEENKENEYFNKLMQEDDLLDDIDILLEQIKKVKDKYNIDLLSLSVGNRCAMSSAHYEDEARVKRITAYDYIITDGKIELYEV